MILIKLDVGLCAIVIHMRYGSRVDNYHRQSSVRLWKSILNNDQDKNTLFVHIFVNASADTIYMETGRLVRFEHSTFICLHVILFTINMWALRVGMDKHDTAPFLPSASNYGLYMK